MRVAVLGGGTIARLPGPPFQFLDRVRSGYVSAEALPLPDPTTAARKTIESFRRYFAEE